ncbi:MAG: MotA/TolQ/ExbB proton channel family protein [Oxalobacteraceae bacterium]|jgi:chemotaxis protein MotA|nr:MotA/TolQ/ExbB proton channel family protein [Oxalobacteraceae bacterium]
MSKPQIQSGSVIGVVGALVLIALATGGNFLQFVDIPAILIVFGGTFLCVLSKSTLPEFKSAFNTAREAVSHSPTRLTDLIDEMIEVGRVARYNDRWMVLLEDREYNDRFIAKAVRLWVDGLEPVLMKDALLRELAEEKTRFDNARDFFAYAQELAPAMGMIGTLLGLVLMMGNMTDPRAIGPGMAVALLTTLYGAILSNVVLGPMVQKIMGHGKRVKNNYELVIAGMMFLQKGGDPRMLPDLLLGNLKQTIEPEPEPEALPVPDPEPALELPSAETPTAETDTKS